MRELKDRIAFITGGAKGIGLATAEAMAREGVKIAIADLDTAALSAAEQRLTELGASVVTIELDVASQESWGRAAKTVRNALGEPDILCNNAGIGQGHYVDGRQLSLAELPEAVWRSVMETNVNGVYFGLRAFVPSMIERGGPGHVVNVSSMAGLIAPPGLAAYAASKFAVMAMSEALRGELEPHGIGVSVLCPGGVSTSFVATAAARVNALAGETPEAIAPQPSNPGSARMDPSFVGKRIVEAIVNNELYVFTHPEYRPLVEERHAAVASGFRRGAQPGYHDPASLIARSRSEVYRSIVEHG